MSASTPPGEKSLFERQRESLLSEIALAFEHVLMNMNTLNRNLESVVAVGREFESVEALWAQFEGVMGKDPEAAAAAGQDKENESKQDDEEGDVTMEG